MMRACLACVFATVLCTAAIAQTTQSDEFATHAARIELNSRTDLARRVEAVLVQEARFVTAQLHPWNKDSTALLLFKGSSTEPDIRSDGHLAYGLATIARTMPDNPFAAEAKKNAIAVLRFLLQTHGAGGITCNDGKQWHNQWQSAFWAHSAGKAAWLLWDDLDPKLQDLAARMIADEADRFINVTPPAQVIDDTKAEENAWDSMVISLAAAMFPHHPHHAKWQETAIRWAVSSYVNSKDVKSDQVIDGRPLKDWVSQPNIHDDYTLENHNRVHPDYMANIRLNLTQELDYGWGGIKPPASLRFNATNVYASLKKLDFPDGGFVYPNGQDWHLHRADFFDIHTMMALDFDDPQAARMMLICLQEIQKMQARHADGSISEPNEVLSPSAHLIQMEEIPDAYFHLRKYGDGPTPVDESELWRQLSGKHVFTFGKFALLRTPTSVATFSWGRQVMGMVLPLRKDLLLSPNDRSLIGNIEIAGKRDTPIVKSVTLSPIDNILAVSGTIERGGGAISQRFAFVALPDGRTVYVDAVDRSAATTQPSKIDLGLLGILNEPAWIYQNGSRTLDFDGGQRVFHANTNSEADYEGRSPWYCIDGLGIVCLKATGKQRFYGKPTATRGRREQTFVLNKIDPEQADGAETALVLYPNVDADRAPKLARSCKLDQPSQRQFAIALDDGKTVDIDLDQLTVNCK